MPAIQCPVIGFESSVVTWPDEWLIKHINDFNRGYQAAPDGSSQFVLEVYGVLELVVIDGLDLKDGIERQPLYYRSFFDWLVDTVYRKSYLPAMSVKKKQSEK